MISSGSLACPRCHCRVVSRSLENPNRLVCCDCGHPMEEHLEARRRPRLWQTTLLLVAFGISLMGLLGLGDLLMEEPLEVPPERRENSRQE